MVKPIIREITSKEYRGGRVDRFLIPERIDIHKELVSLLSDLGFPNKNLEEFDFITSEGEGYFFSSRENLRFHLVISNNEINMILDSSLEKEELISKVEKYFQIFS